MRLEQVAERAGVAVDTARRALRHEPSVRSYIKERVLQAARELNYHPNLVARALRDNNLNFIPILAPMVGELYFGNLASAVARSLVGIGLQPALCINTDHLIKMSLSFSTRGCILVNAGDPKTIATLAKQQKVVAVGLDIEPTDSVAGVKIAFDESYANLARHLLKRGHRKIAVVSDFYQNCLDKNWPLQKFPVVFKTLAQNGLEPVVPRKNAVFTSGETFVKWLKRHPGAVDAVLCENDLAAAQVIGELATLKLATPEDLLVVGCDATCKLKGMGSIKLDTTEIAALATATLKKLMDGEAVPESPVYVPELLDESNKIIR